MARPYKPLDQQKTRRTKDVQEIKEQAEKNMNDLESIQIDAPTWLSPLAKEEYNRIYPLLKELPIASLDLGLVSAYCQSYSDYVEATAQMQIEDTIIVTPNGSKLNPLHTIKRDSFNIMNSIAPKLGMSIDSRMKIFTPQAKSKEPDDPMSGYYDS